MNPEEKLARAAARHRRGQPQPQAGGRGPVPRVLDESLSDPVGAMKVVEIVIGSLALFVPLVAMAAAGVDIDSTVALVVGTVAGVACMCVFLLVRTRLAIAMSRRAIRSFGFGVDVDGYLEQLATPRDDGPVVASIRFARALDPAARALVADAARGLSPDLARADWSGSDGVLEVASGELCGVESVVTSTGATRWFTNRLAHHWCLRLMRRVVPKLHAVHPIARVELQLCGRPTRD